MSENKAEFAVVEILNSNATLATELAGRVTPLVREDDLLPAIVYTGSEPIWQRYLDGDFMDIATVDMSFQVWATGYVQAKRLAGIIIGLLNNFSGEVAGISVLTIDCDPGDETGAWDGDEIVIEFSATITAKGL